MPPFPSASDAFKIYNSDGNYNTTPHEHHYEFRYADVAFFVMDTRRYRSGVDEGDEVPTMLGDKQLVELYSWLGRVRHGLSSFPFTLPTLPRIIGEQYGDIQIHRHFSPFYLPLGT